MALNAAQREDLRKALMSAFPTFRKMEWLADALDKSLEAIAGPGGLSDATYVLVRDAIAGGWEDALIAKAAALQPGNPDVRRFVESNWLPLSAPPSKQLQTMIRPGETFQDVEGWIARLQEAGPRVCCIIVQTTAGPMKGTGFLVGPDLVLTNYHVLEPVILGERGQTTAGGSAVGAGISGRSRDVTFLFDYKELPGGGPLNGGRKASLRAGSLDQWLVADSPYSPLDLQAAPAAQPSQDELDYALVRLAEAPGEDSVAGRRRGTVQLCSGAAAAPDSALFIIQHPQGQPLKLAFHVVKDIAATRITYGTNTRQGSSGSPCFSYEWSLVAMHHSGDPGYKSPRNQGIPCGVICRDLATRGVSLPS